MVMFRNMIFKRLWPYLSFFFGIGLIAAYWYWLKPHTGGLIGYTEDLGLIELPRQIMADSLAKYGRPAFFATRVMAPFGISGAFFPWAMERDWIGAWIWNHYPSVPWLWIYFGLSLTIAYVGVGWILGKMGVARAWAWLLAVTVVLFHVPRHFKIYYHYEHLIQHWAYIAAFLDAWLWQKFWRDRKWSLQLEAWRGVLLIATLGLGGYYWGGMLLEWLIVRGFMIGAARRRFKRGERTEIEGWSLRPLGLPLAVGAVWLLVALFWFVPLFSRYLEFGNVPQTYGWVADWWMVFRPLWIDPLVPAFKEWLPFDRTETVVTVGWTLCLPVVFGVVWSLRRLGGAGLGILAPFLLWGVLAVFYVHGGWLYFVQSYIRHLVPFMKFFRVASRMAIFFPVIAGVITALAWPELVRRVRSCSRLGRGAFAGSLLVMVALEIPVLMTPVVQDPTLTPETQALLEKVRQLPGDQVLDLPFCVVGGNGVCEKEQCSFGPHSVTPSLLTSWHRKRVYGVYEGRLAEKHCRIYQKFPYVSWFQAWRENRCFNDTEWNQFCDYLKMQPSLSAVMLYPGIWTAAADPACRAEFDKRLGAPLGEARFATQSIRGAKSLDELGASSILWYSNRCR